MRPGTITGQFYIQQKAQEEEVILANAINFYLSVINR